MQVLSLGAGVQSTTLLLMAREGELTFDCAIFADTEWEPAAVYRHLDWLQSVSPVPIHRVGAGSIREQTLAVGRRFASLPLYVRGPHGDGIGRRQCTKEYKLRPIQRKLRELGATAAQPVEIAIGFSLDEVVRMADSRVRYARHIYPLIERRMTRGDCLTWLTKRGYPEPMKSACIGCPYRRDAEWRRLTPDEFADAVDFDQRIRTHNAKMHGEQFVHRSMIPLADVDLRSPQDRGQIEMFEPMGCSPFGCRRDAA
jgi:hypothetical protein